MMLLLVILLEIYLRVLRAENVYGVLSTPSFVKRGVGGRFNYSNLFKINLPKPLFTKEGLFYDVAFNILGSI